TSSSSRICQLYDVANSCSHGSPPSSFEGHSRGEPRQEDHRFLLLAHRSVCTGGRYALLGAVIFQAVEGPHEEQIQSSVTAATLAERLDVRCGYATFRA
ncbi:hypothetical protein OSTOST_22084, partial [Ostertagia ostertagi]